MPMPISDPRIAYLDCRAGVAGDMWLGAMVDAGLPPSRLAEGWRQLPRSVASVRFFRVRRAGIAATAVEVHPRESFRSPLETERFLRRGRWPGGVRDSVLRAFRRLVRAERAAHGGAGGFHHGDLLTSADTVIDLVGVCWGMTALGITRLAVSPLPLGFVAPATADLLRDLVVVPAPPPVRSEEIVTPTGAALVATLTTSADLSPFRVIAAGSGAGSVDVPGIPNILRLLVGVAIPAGQETQMPISDPLWVVEANLDDCSPEWVAHAQAELLHRGALDAWVTPATMKKGRAGVILGALVPFDRLAAAEATILSETTTLGLRRYPVTRTVLPRRMVRRRTAFGPVRVKQARRNGTWTGKPEYDDLARLARRRGVALRRVAKEAGAA